MGKIQCISIKHKTDSWQMIEKHLNNINTPLEKKIHDEYYIIKSKQKDDDNIPKKKKLQRFLKWYIMSTNLENPIIKSNTEKLNLNKEKYVYSPLTSLANLESNNDKISQFSAFDQHSEIKIAKSSTNSQFSSIELEYPNSHSISINSHISTNQFEKNLRSFYFKDKIKFKERVYKSPPECYRWISWIICASIPEDRSDELFLSYLKDNIDENVDTQIKKDLNRTLADIYDLNPSDSQNYLYRILRSFSNLDKLVSYCQGMNFIAGFLLMISDFNEVDSFYMLVSLFSETFSDNYGIRGFYSEDFPLLKVYLYVFEYYFSKKLPNLYKHFDELEIPNEVWISKWFQTLYTICLPINILVRFWDAIITNGLDFMINFSISLMCHIEKDLLKMKDAFDVIDFFKRMGPFYYTDSKFHINIEEVLIHSKKLGITRNDFNELKLVYEKSSKISLTYLKVKHDIYKPLKGSLDSLSYEISNNYKITKSTSVCNNYSCDIYTQEQDDVFIDCDEIEDNSNVGIKMSNYELKVNKMNMSNSNMNK